MDVDRYRCKVQTDDCIEDRSPHPRRCETVNVRRLRRKAEMSQSEFASYFGVSVRTVQDWEQGRRVPSGASRAFLLVIDREPEAVRRALTAN